MEHYRFVQKLAVVVSIILCWASLSAFSFGLGDKKEPELKEKRVPDSAEQIQLSFAPLVKKTAPAVVNIYSTRRIKIREISPFFNDPLFKHFFGNTFNSGTSERTENSLGSGVIVKPNGYIITSYHVIAKSDDITVVLSDRREFAAKVIVADERTDLALLQIDLGKSETLPYLELMNSDELEVGDLVLAIGNPFAVGQTVTSGIVSAVARTTEGIADYQFFIQTDAAINPGNSGGALVTLSGKLAGINTAIYTRSGGSNGIGFAIPANMVETVINGGTGEGRIVRPWLGLHAEPVTQAVADSLGLERPHGALVKDIYPESPAKKAGIQVGDVITAIDETKIIDSNELNFRVATYKLGSVAEFQVVREGHVEKLKVDMEPPIEKPSKDLRLLDGTNPFSGATVANLSPAVADMLGLQLEFMKPGVIITSVADNSTARRVGLQPRDVIVQVGGNTITSTKQLKELLDIPVAKYKISIMRNGRMINIILSGKF